MPTLFYIKATVCCSGAKFPSGKYKRGDAILSISLTPSMDRWLSFHCLLVLVYRSTQPG